MSFKTVLGLISIENTPRCPEQVKAGSHKQQLQRIPSTFKIKDQVWTFRCVKPAFYFKSLQGAISVAAKIASIMTFSINLLMSSRSHLLLSWLIKDNDNCLQLSNTCDQRCIVSDPPLTRHIKMPTWRKRPIPSYDRASDSTLHFWNACGGIWSCLKEEKNFTDTHWGRVFI